jgi:hypothetical protein
MQEVTRAGFEVALLDINLHAEVAFQVADELGRQSVLFLSATGYDASAIPSRFAGVKRWEKPYNPADLISDVGDLCAGREPSVAVPLDAVRTVGRGLNKRPRSEAPNARTVRAAPAQDGPWSTGARSPRSLRPWPPTTICPCSPAPGSSYATQRSAACAKAVKARLRTALPAGFPHPGLIETDHVPALRSE